MNVDRQAYEEDLRRRQQEHLGRINSERAFNWRPCMHDQCTQCHGTGQTAFGPCIHAISCPCPKCMPTY